MDYFSFFTGAGGFEHGMPADWKCIGMSEIDRNGKKSLYDMVKDGTLQLPQGPGE